MWRLGAAGEDEALLASAWRAADPFPHLVIDELLVPDALARLMALLEEEPVHRFASDIFAFEASAPEPVSAELRDLRAAFASTLAPPLSRITGIAVTTVDMRAYAYRAGCYLLPHSDHQHGLGRALAYAYYLPSPEPPTDGALELFRCELEAGQLTSMEPARLIAPEPNRLVVFEVSDRSLHQVREVLGGLRISLAGWFYP